MTTKNWWTRKKWFNIYLFIYLFIYLLIYLFIYSLILNVSEKEEISYLEVSCK